MTTEELERKTQEVKLEVLKMCINAGQGHVTSAFSCAEIVTALYYEIMDVRPDEPDWPGRDRFIMSKNHASVILYPILQDMGFLDRDTKIDFMKNGSKFGGHSKAGIPGVEFSGGSLGIGLGVACGMAYHAKIEGERHRVYVLVGDGECYEGAIWESIMFAGHNELSNLVMVIDRNWMAITDYTEKMLKLEPLEEKVRAFNWDAVTIDGHDMQAVVNALGKKTQGRPMAVICNTIKGNGVSSLSNKMFKHGVAPKGKEAEEAVAEIERRMQSGN